MADINKLKDKIKSTIYPNGKGAINASDHQAMLLDMADGMAETDTKLAKLSAKISGGESSTTIAEFADKGKFLYENITLDSTQYDITDYILLTGVTKVVLSNLWGAPNGVLPYVIYNENKSVIVKAELPTEPSLVNVVLTSLPSDAKYIRCTRDNSTLEPSTITLYKKEGTGLEQKVEHLENNVGGLQDEDKKIKQSVQIVQNDIDTLFEKINGGEQEEVITEFIDKGKFLYGNSTLDSSSYNISDYVKIDGAKKVVLTNVYGASNGVLPYVIYNSKKLILQKADIPSSDAAFNYELIDLPDGAYYIRCTQDITTPQPTITVYYSGGGIEERIDALEQQDATFSEKISKIEEEISGESVEMVMGKIKNLISDFTTFSAQHLNTSSGELASSTSFTTSAFVKVEPNKTYCGGYIDKSYGGYKVAYLQEVCFYDENKQFLSAVTSVTSFSTPNNAEYIRFSVLSSIAFGDGGIDDIAVCEIVEGDAPISVFSKDFIENAVVKGGLYGKKWLLIGDSNTEHNFRASAKYDEFISADTGVIPTNIGKSGAGYRVYQNAEYVFLNIFNQFISKNPNYQPDFITIMGGSNDILYDWENIGSKNDTTSASVFGMIHILIERIKAVYPTTPFAILTPFPHDYAENTPHIAEFVTELKEFCFDNNIPCLDLQFNSGLRPTEAAFNKKYYSCASEPNGDGLHLNYFGQQLIASRIKAFLTEYYG